MQAGTQRGLAPLRFKIDKAVSRFSVQAFATGLLSVFGHNPRIGIGAYEGEITFIPETYAQAFVRITVPTSAMEVQDEMKKDDRKKLEEEMYGNVLEIDRFPMALFESKEIAIQSLATDLLQALVTGDLSFHGVTRSLSFDARVNIVGTMLRISGEFPLRQTDYGIKPVSFAAGALRLKDELKFSFNLVARPEE